MCSAQFLYAYGFEEDGIYYDKTSDNTVSVTSGNNKYTGEVTIPETVENDGVTYSVTSIGDRAFYQCSGLTELTIPNSVTSIGDYAFYNCNKLQKVNILDLATWCQISCYSAYSNPLYYAHHLYMNGEEVKDLVIPESVTTIGSNAFNGCSGLTSVQIPESVISISDDAFSGCSGLTSVTIPQSVTSLGNGVFYECI